MNRWKMWIGDYIIPEGSMNVRAIFHVNPLSLLETFISNQMH